MNRECGTYDDFSKEFGGITYFLLNLFHRQNVLCRCINMVGVNNFVDYAEPLSIQFLIVWRELK